MHCTAMSKRIRSFVNRLKEGNIYTINHFAVIPNTEEYPIIGNSAYIIHFHGHITARRSSVKSDGFVRHPFDLLPFDDLQDMDETYLIGNVQFTLNFLSQFE